MLTRSEYLEHHWLPYTMCEEDFLTILEYVALRPSNLSTSSEKLIRSLLSSCELFEALMKQMYVEEFGGGKPLITDYIHAIVADSEFDQNQTVVLKRGVDLGARRPLAEIEDGNAPAWWKAHNEVKHNHSKNFEQGSLRHALDALSALYLSNLVFARKIGTYWKAMGETEGNSDVDVPNDISHLFDCPKCETRYHIASRDSYYPPNDDLLSYLGL